MLLVTRQRWHSRLTPAEAGTRCSDPGGMQGWVDQGGWLVSAPSWSSWCYESVVSCVLVERSDSASLGMQGWSRGHGHWTAEESRTGRRSHQGTTSTHTQTHTNRSTVVHTAATDKTKLSCLVLAQLPVSCLKYIEDYTENLEIENWIETRSQNCLVLSISALWTQWGSSVK